MKIIILLISLSFIFVQGINLKCKTSQSDVTSFTAIKPPKDITSKIKTYLIFDNNTSEFKYHENEIDEVGGPLNMTISQFNQEGIQLLIWNDQPPNTTYYNPDGAHSKGIIAYSPESDSAIYILHSCPRYPSYNQDGGLNSSINYSQTYLGQLFHCQELNGSNLDVLLSGLQITNITVNKNTLQYSNYTFINEFANNNYYVNSSENSKFINFNLDSIPIVAVFKRDTFIRNIYEDIIVPHFQDSVYTETWGEPYIPANCSLNGSYFVKNIGEIKFDDSQNKFLALQDSSDEWSTNHEHSKWLVMENQKIACVGDMNHMTTQMSRGGSFMCFNDEKIYNAFTGIIDWFYDCDGSKVDFKSRHSKINKERKYLSK